MKNLNYIINLQSIKYFFASTAFLLLFGGQIQPAAAQNVDFGADFVNRYVWRGIDFGDAASAQPYIEFSAGGFTVGTWASYSLSPVSAGFNEHDLYLSYSFGFISIGVTDYYFPNAEGNAGHFFNFDDRGEGAHIIEPQISITGGKSFPVTLYAAINAYNDPDHSIYLQASVPFSIGETDLDFTIGGVPTTGEGETAGYYGNSKPAITNIQLSVSRKIKITDSFSLPLLGSYILNPYAEQSYLVFGLSL